MRRARRSRIGTKLYNQVLYTLINNALADDNIIQYISEGNDKKAFGKLLNKWIDSSKESVIDRHVDEDAFNITWHAINTIKVRLTS